VAITVNEAGRRGGLACFWKLGRQFYIEIGRKGQRAMRSRYPQMARHWGQLGGRPRKLNLKDMGKAEYNSKKGE
jgi:general stress protein YciG